MRNYTAIYKRGRGGTVTDDELLELLERVHSNLDMVCKVGLSHQDPHEDQVLAFNSGVQRLIDAGFDMDEWLIPEGLLRHMYGQKSLPDGRLVPLRRVPAAAFLQRANPALQYLAREIRKRKQAQAGGSAMAKNPATDPSEIWVIHGRDREFRRKIFSLLRAVELRPIEFQKAVARSGSGSPVVIDLILREIHNAPAVISLMTPDESCELREEFRDEPKDAAEHIQAGFQPRPNVLLETGISLGALREKTLIVVKDPLRPISNLGGVHVVHWDDSTAKRIELVERLRGLGIPVDTSGNDWQHP